MPDGFKLLIALALGAGMLLLSFATWLAFQAWAWALDHLAWLLSLPLGDAIRVLANL